MERGAAAEAALLASLLKAPSDYSPFKSPLKALELIKTGKVDLMFLDIQMPVLDGFGATEAIRQAESLTGAHVPIIALTAHALEGYREKCLAAGMDDFLTKPLQPKVLRETLSLWSPRNLSPAGK
mgnify:CR=1 FL=1